MTCPRSPLSRRSQTAGLLLLAAMMLLFSACGTSISGRVFVDENANGTFEQDEIGIPSAKLTVTRANSTVGEGYSDARGVFAIPITRGKGQVCITADLTTPQEMIRVSDASDEKGISAPAMRLHPPKGQSLTSTSSTSGTTASTDTTKKDEPDTKDEESKETEPEPEPPVPTGWFGEKYCGEALRGGFSIDFPVRLDYSKALSKVGPIHVTCPAGTPCQIEIDHPGTCTLNPITLPEGLVAEPASQAGLSINAAGNVITFSSTSAGSKAQSASASSLSLSLNTLDRASVSLVALESVALGSTEATIKPTAECQGETLNLAEIDVSILRDANVAVLPDLKTTGALSAGQQIEIAVRLENRGKSSVRDGELLVTLPSDSQVVSAPTGCRNLGNRLACTVDLLKAGDTTAYDFAFTLSTLDDREIGESVDMEVTDEFQVGDKKTSGPSIVFTVKKAQPIVRMPPPRDFPGILRR